MNEALSENVMSGEPVIARRQSRRGDPGATYAADLRAAPRLLRGFAPRNDGGRR